MFKFSKISATEKGIILVISLVGLASDYLNTQSTIKETNKWILETIKGKDLSEGAQKMVKDWCLLCGVKKVPTIITLSDNQPANSPYKAYEKMPFVLTADGRTSMLCLPECYVAGLNRRAKSKKNNETLFNGDHEMAFLIGHEVNHIKRFEQVPYKSALFLDSNRNKIIWCSFPIIWFVLRFSGLGIGITLVTELVKRFGLAYYAYKVRIQEEFECDKNAIFNQLKGFNENAFKGGLTFLKKVMPLIDSSCSNVITAKLYDANKDFWCEYLTKHPHPEKRIEQLKELRFKQFDVKH